MTPKNPVPMNPSVEAYIADRDYTPVFSPNKAAKLRRVEEVLSSLSLTWTTIPKDLTWLEVYEKLDTISSQRLALFDSAISSFYQYLIDKGILSKQDSRYVPITLSKIFASFVRKKYPSSLRSLLTAYDKASTSTARLTEQGKYFNRLILSLLWEGFETQELIDLKAEDFFFKDGAPMRPKDDHYYLANHPVLDYELCEQLKMVQTQAVSSYPPGTSLKEIPLLLLPGAGKKSSDSAKLNLGSFTMRIKRLISSINKVNGTDYTTPSIQEAGAYNRAYQEMLAKHLCLVCSHEQLAILYRHLRKNPDVYPNLKKAEFQKYLEYINAFKEAILDK